MSQPTVLNLSFYQFVSIPNPEALRDPILKRMQELELRGTIWISQEGLNANISGDPRPTRSMVDFLRELDPRFLADVEPKESWSEERPFNRTLVRIKKELVPTLDPEINPACFTGPRVTAQELDQWYAQGEDMVVLDTRNTFEYEMGTFKNAEHLDLATFRQFEVRLNELREKYGNDKKIVTFCTGGIRCEKASPIMLKNGFKNVYQLDGGILKYFEETDGKNWDGECFVFDRRVALDTDLRETETDQCYACQAILSPEDQKHPDYVPYKACGYCQGKKNPESIAKTHIADGLREELGIA